MQNNKYLIAETTKEERIMVYKIKNNSKIESLFNNWQETLIWSCQQDVMGHLYTTSLDDPQSVMALVGDFCFFAGKPDKELVSFKPQWCQQDFVIMTPQSKEWSDLIEGTFDDRATKVQRYAIKKEMDIFDADKLKGIVASMSAEYELKMIDEEWFNRCREMSWCRDLVAQFDTYEMYEKYGLGVILLKDDQVVSGASSYSAYKGGIEIEIDTRKDYRRKGLASICGAKLILECLDRGLYPSWDAQNMGSVALAEKLGYHFDHAYDAYEVQW